MQPKKSFRIQEARFRREYRSALQNQLFLDSAYTRIKPFYFKVFAAVIFEVF